MSEQTLYMRHSAKKHNLPHATGSFANPCRPHVGGYDYLPPGRAACWTDLPSASYQTLCLTLRGLGQLPGPGRYLTAHSLAIATAACAGAFVLAAVLRSSPAPNADSKTP